MALTALKELEPARATEALKNALGSKNDAVRHWACMQLSKEKDEAGTAALAGALKDESDRVRLAAAQALATRGEASGREALAKYLANRDTARESRQMAAATLAHLSSQPADETVKTGLRTALEPALDDPDVAVRYYATEGLRKLKDKAAVPALMKRVADEVFEDKSGKGYGAADKEMALTALKELAPDRAVEALLGALQSKNEAVWAWACSQLKKEKDQPSAAALVAALGDTAENVRLAAAAALAARGEASGRDALIKYLSDRTSSVRARQSAVRALAEGPVRGESVSAALVGALGDPDATVRMYAAAGLQKLGDKSAVPALIKRVADDVLESGYGDKNTALVAIKELAPDKASEALAEALKSKNDAVREWAVNYLRVEKDAASTRGLIQALEDPADRVRINAAFGLSERKDKDSAAALIKALQDRAANVRLTAVNALAARGEAAAREPVAKLAKDDPDATVRAAAVQALPRLSGDSKP